MANYFQVTLDTLGPANPAIVIEAGATYVSTQLVNTAISCSDGTKTGYQMKIWGSVDPTYDTDVQPLEANSNWITYDAAKQVKLSTTDGTKTLYLKIRDDVNNESSQANDTVTLDTLVPVVTLTGPTVSKISKQTGKNSFQGSFTVDTSYEEYMVKVVPASGSDHTVGTIIPTTGGSTNTSGNAGGYAGATPVTFTIYGADLETASTGDGAKIIKVFVREASGNWSV